jgi:hypothetical protein
MQLHGSGVIETVAETLSPRFIALILGLEFFKPSCVFLLIFFPDLVPFPEAVRAKSTAAEEKRCHGVCNYI